MSLEHTIKEIGFAQAYCVKMDAVNLQGVWPLFPQQGAAVGPAPGHAPKVGAFIYYLLNEEQRRRQNTMDISAYAAPLTLDETIKRFEIREATDYALLLAEL